MPSEKFNWMTDTIVLRSHHWSFVPWQSNLLYNTWMPWMFPFVFGFRNDKDRTKPRRLFSLCSCHVQSSEAVVWRVKGSCYFLNSWPVFHQALFPSIVFLSSLSMHVSLIVPYILCFPSLSFVSDPHSLYSSRPWCYAQLFRVKFHFFHISILRVPLEVV